MEVGEKPDLAFDQRVKKHWQDEQELVVAGGTEAANRIDIQKQYARRKVKAGPGHLER